MFKGFKYLYKLHYFIKLEITKNCNTCIKLPKNLDIYYIIYDIFIYYT